MTRKKFIKLLMGEYCMDRNTARRSAEHVQRRGGSYLDELIQCERIVLQFSFEYGIPRSVLLAREKGFDKLFRKYQRGLRRNAGLVCKIYELSPAADGGYPIGGACNA